MKRIMIGLLSFAMFVPGLLGHAAESAPQEKQEFAKKHPRRAEVNQRIENQKKALRHQLKSGKITQAQYDAEMAKLTEIKSEEKTDVKTNGGHLTKNEQKDLNKDLNTTRQEIKPYTPPPPPSPAPSPAPNPATTPPLPPSGEGRPTSK